MTPVIDPTACRLVFEVKHTSPLIGCRFDPTGRFLFFSAQDNSIQRYDLLARQKSSLTGHSSWVRALAFTGGAGGQVSTGHHAFPALAGGLGLASTPPTPFTLISGDYHGRLVWWEGGTEQPTPTRSVQAHDGWLRAAAVNPDGNTVATCGNDRLVRLWSAGDGKPLRTLEGHTSHVYNVAFHPSGKTLASADLMGTVKVWDIEAGKPIRELDAKAFHKYDTTFAADIGGVRGMTYSPDGAVLACVGITNVSNAFAGVGNPLVLLFDAKEDKPRPFKPKDAFQGTGWGVAFLPTGHVVAAGGAGQGRIWFWKPDDPTSIHTVNVPSNARDLSLHPDGSTLAVAAANGTAYVYSLLPGPPVPKSPSPGLKKK